MVESSLHRAPRLCGMRSVADPGEDNFLYNRNRVSAACKRALVDRCMALGFLFRDLFLPKSGEDLNRSALAAGHGIAKPCAKQSVHC